MLTTPEFVYKPEIDQFLKELKGFCQEQKLKKLVYLDEIQACNISISETYRAILDFQFSNNNIRNIFISHLESVHRYSPGAAAYLPFLVSALSEYDVDINHDSFLKITLEPTVVDINDIIESLFDYSSLLSSDDYRQIFLENGFISSFSIKKSSSFQNACIFHSGFFINGNIPDLFLSTAKDLNLDLMDSHLIIYDGYIQEISELNLILNQSHENKETFVILARGASQDVQHTCAMNISLKKANVILFHPNELFWKNNVTYLQDAGELKIYGYATGMFLNNFNPEKQNKKSILIKPNGIFIRDKKLNLNKAADTTIFLNPSIWHKRGIVRDQIDFFVSVIQQIATCGIVSSKSFLELTRIDLNDLTGLNCNSHPAFPVFRGLNEAKNILNKIFNIGCIIKREH